MTHSKIVRLIALVEGLIATCDHTVDCSDCPFTYCPIAYLIDMRDDLNRAYQIELNRIIEIKLSKMEGDNNGQK